MRALLTISAAAVLMVGCSSSDSISPPVVVPPPLAPSAKVSFISFVADAFNQDADAEPVEIDEENIRFDADDDPTAFDALIQATASANGA